MADFTNFDAKAKAFIQADALVSAIRNIYSQSARLRTIMATYQAGTDANLTAAVNAAFSAAQRTELGAVIQSLSAMATDLENNHASLIGH